MVPPRRLQAQEQHKYPPVENNGREICTMLFHKLRLAAICFELVAASVLLFAGSAFLFAASYGIAFPRGTIQLIPLILMFGATLAGAGMILAWDAATRLKVNHLGIIVVTDLLGAFIFIFLVVSPPSDLALGWLGIASLNSILLIVAFFAGHKAK